MVNFMAKILVQKSLFFYKILAKRNPSWYHLLFFLLALFCVRAIRKETD